MGCMCSSASKSFDNSKISDDKDGNFKYNINQGDLIYGIRDSRDDYMFEFFEKNGFKEPHHVYADDRHIHAGLSSLMGKKDSEYYDTFKSLAELERRILNDYKSELCNIHCQENGYTIDAGLDDERKYIHALLNSNTLNLSELKVRSKNGIISSIEPTGGVIGFKIIRRACKFAIDYTILTNHRIHFILDGLDIKGIVLKKTLEQILKRKYYRKDSVLNMKPYVPITTSELRKVFRFFDAHGEITGNKFFYFYRNKTRVTPPWGKKGSKIYNHWYQAIIKKEIVFGI